ncbi:MAG: urease accessory protein [Alphaproteobacteria bacterium]|jgi:urease accessory protein|nr:urease accessory protein [Alphaproteobacteria bacterium]
MKATSAAISPFEPVSSSSAGLLPRAQGELRLGFKRRGALTVLDTLYQQGCAKARLPNVEENGWKSAVAINTSGGLTGGDRLAIAVDWRQGAQALVAGQAAEKIYRASSGTAQVRTRLTVGAAAQAEWLPQETILFNNAALDRDTIVTLMPDSRFLGIEAVVLGREAMGESVQQGSLRDAWRIHRGGRLIYADVISVHGDIAQRFARTAIAGGARAFATILHVAPDAERKLEAVRAAIEELEEAQAGASCWDGLLAVRLVARDGEALLAAIRRALEPLREGRALPRVWKC